MHDRGQFLELSVPTEDIQASLEFYMRLGFTEVPVNDIRDYYYAVVTDGRIAIGLHADGYEEITLSFVWPDVRRQVREFEDAGHELTFVKLGDDEFHEAELFSPDGHPLRLLEAPTFSRQSYTNTAATLVGRVIEITLRSDDDRTSSAFWQTAGLDTDEVQDDAEDVTTLYAPGIVIGLRDTLRWREPLLRFRPDDPRETLDVLERRDIAHRRHPEGRLITTLEGLRLLIVADD